jgi:hypothetical protein
VNQAVREKQRTGPDVLVYGSEQERLAVVVVKLFVELIKYVSMEEREIREITIYYSQLHLYTMAFVRALKLHLSDMPHRLDLYRERDGHCPAVELYERAYRSPIGHSLGLVYRSAPESVPAKEDLKLLAQKAGLSAEGDWERLLAAARAAFADMLGG